MTTRKLTARKKADREAMLLQVTALAAEFGFTVERCEILSDSKTIHFHIVTEHGLRAMMDFDGGSRDPDYHLIHWHFSRGSGAVENDCHDVPENRGEPQLSPDYWRNLNTCHYRKATGAASTEGLLDVLRDNFTAIKDGRAFAADPIRRDRVEFAPLPS